MKKILSGSAFPAALTAGLAIAGNFAVLLVCLILGFGVHTFGGILTLYIALALQAVSILVLFLRRCSAARKFKVPEPSRKMRIFRDVNLTVWCVCLLVLAAALLMDLLWLGASHPLVIALRIAGAVLSPLSWTGVLASFYRRKQATLLSRK